MKPPPAEAPLPAMTRLVRGLLVALVIWTVYFVARLLLLRYSFTVTPEECHTGGIAAEVLAHGVRFPLVAYSPERYENGIIVNGFLAIPFFVLFGQNVLSLKLLATTISTLNTLVGLALLKRVLDYLQSSPAERIVARVLYVVMLAFGPLMFTYKSLDSLGDENEAALATMVLLLLLFRRMEAPSRVRQATLWVAMGLAASWHLGTLLVTALVAFYELRSVRNRSLPARALSTALLCFFVGYLPGLVAGWTNGFLQYSTVMDKFMHPGTGFASLFVSWARTASEYAYPNPLWLVLFVAGFIWLVSLIVRVRFSEPLAYLGLYAAGHQVMMLNANGHSDYFVYVHYVLLLPLAAWGARLVFTPVRSKGLRYVGAGVVIMLVAGIIWPDVAPDLGRPKQLKNETARAACYWRFGRAFIHRTSDTAEAMGLCRSLGGDAAMECISGIGLESARAPSEVMGQTPGERWAFAYGKGQGFVRDLGDFTGCVGLDEPEEQATCRSGAIAQCAMYADLRSLGRLSAPSCTMLIPPFDSITRTWMTALTQRPKFTSEIPLFRDDGGQCDRVMKECFSGQSNPL